LRKREGVAEGVKSVRVPPVDIRRGQIWNVLREYTIFPNDSNPDPKPERPWLVVSAESINKNSDASYVIIAEITKWAKPSKKESQPYDSFVKKTPQNGLEFDSFVEATLLRPIMRSLLVKQTFRGKLTQYEMYDVDRALKTSLGLQ